MPEAKLYIIRHAESQQNAHQEQSPSEFAYCSLNPLTQVGKEQAIQTGIELRRRLQGVPSSSILLFSSPHLRTMQTSEIIRGEINKERSEEDQIISFSTDKKLLEQKWGILEPQYHDNAIVRRLYDAYKGVWNDAASYMRHPLLPEEAVTQDVRQFAHEVGLNEDEIRGESGNDVTIRLHDFLANHQDELNSAGMNMIIVTSRAPVLMSKVVLGNEDPDELAGRITRREIEIPNASVTTYIRENWKLEPYSDVLST